MSTPRLWTLADRVDLSREVSTHVRQVASPGQQPSRPTVTSTRESLERLCGEGFLGDAVPTAASRDLARTAGVLATLARDDLSMAFVAWAHRMAIEYVIRSHDGAFPTETIRGLTRGQLIGATAMAPAFQANLGLRDVDVRATTSGDRLVVDGRIGWASNLHPDGSVIVFAARHADGSHVVVAVPTPSPGVTLHDYPRLLGMQSTASTGAALHDVQIPRSWIIAPGLEGFITAVRPTFLLLQAAFCIGLAEAALIASSEAGSPHGPVRHVWLALHRRHRDTAQRLVTAAARLELAAPVPAHDITKIRLDATRLAVDAVHLEARLAGGRGYLADSDTARRVREAAFLPVQSPTEVQLRWELSRSA